jgi:hypothetical protein
VVAEAEALAREAEAKSVVTTYTLSTGIVLNIRPVPPRIRSEALAKVPKPAIPKVFVEAMGREEENPDDPNYQAAVIAWGNEQFIRGFHVTLVLGTSVRSVPEDRFRPEDDGWIEEVETAAMIAGTEALNVRREPEKARYLDWLLYHALGNEEDHSMLTALLYSLSVVTEEALADAIDSFRGNAPRRIDSALSGSGSGQ